MIAGGGSATRAHRSRTGIEDLSSWSASSLDAYQLISDWGDREAGVITSRHLAGPSPKEEGGRTALTVRPPSDRRRRASAIALAAFEGVVGRSGSRNDASPARPRHYPQSSRARLSAGGRIRATPPRTARDAAALTGPSATRSARSCWRHPRRIRLIGTSRPNPRSSTWAASPPRLTCRFTAALQVVPPGRYLARVFDMMVASSADGQARSGQPNELRAQPAERCRQVAAKGGSNGPERGRSVDGQSGEIHYM